MTSRLYLLSGGSSWYGRKAAAAALPVALATSLLLVQSATLEERKEEASQSVRPLSHQIDINFIDRLASKAYLHFSDHEPDQTSVRPVGVPATLRFLVVDLPEVRQGFKNGICSVYSRSVYPDAIAAPEIIEGKKGRSMIPLEVEQKAWVKSMVRCISEGAAEKASVEIMEADMIRMNPSNIRRIHQYGTLRYDPGKYVATSARHDKKRKDLRDDEETIIRNELDAPWHQQAWKEEASLRISGRVASGDTMTESSPWTRRFFGLQYQSTIPSSNSFLDSIFFWRSSKEDFGIDGSDVPNQTSNRPHAVIANGLALQLVPNSLRVLQKLCAENDVPLFVIRDPRSWGANTHPDDLGQVLRDVQKTVKRRIVTRSLQHAAGTAFQRGRFVGRLEANALWQSSEVVRRSKEVSARALDAFKRQQDTDWSSLSESDLEKRLEYHGLVHKAEDEGESSRIGMSDVLAKVAQRYLTGPSTSEPRVHVDQAEKNEQVP
jgi:hypothetical protein